MNSNNTGFLSSNTTTPFTTTSQGLGGYFNQPQQNTTNSFGMKNSLFGGTNTTINNTNPFSSINQTGFLSNNNTQTNTPTLFGQTSNNIFNQPQQQQQAPFSQSLFPQQNQQQNTLFQQNNPFTTNTSNNQNTLFQNNGGNNQAYANQNIDELAYHRYINELY